MVDLMTGPLSGQVALVTGGASGIGAACVRTLAARGAVVAIADRNLALAEALAAELGGQSLAIASDVTDEASCSAMVGRTVDAFGRLDIAVNCAGIGVPDRRLVADLGWEAWKDVIDINLHGVFLSLKAEIGAMLAGGGGSIVNIASIMGQVAATGASAYVASKHAVVGLTRAAALDYADAGIRVNAVGPGYIDTPLLGLSTDGQRTELASLHPVGRMGTPEEIAKVVAFLASPDASFVTGSFYLADGGYTIP